MTPKELKLLAFLLKKFITKNQNYYPITCENAEEVRQHISKMEHMNPVPEGSELN